MFAPSLDGLDEAPLVKGSDRATDRSDTFAAGSLLEYARSLEAPGGREELFAPELMAQSAEAAIRASGASFQPVVYANAAGEVVKVAWTAEQLLSREFQAPGALAGLHSVPFSELPIGQVVGPAVREEAQLGGGPRGSRVLCRASRGRSAPL